VQDRFIGKFHEEKICIIAKQTPRKRAGATDPAERYEAVQFHRRKTIGVFQRSINEEEKTMKKTRFVSMALSLLFLTFIFMTQASFSLAEEGAGHAQEAVKHSKEAIEHVKQAIKHSEESIKAGGNSHAKESIEHAKEAIKHAEESIAHAEKAGGKAPTEMKKK